jgi:putative membrane protein
MSQKNNEFDFSIPNRQSPVAILLVIFKTSKNILRQIFFPLIVFFFLGRKSDNYGMYFIGTAIIFSTISMIYSIINYYKSHYYIKGKELILNTGFISKKELSIPFERIQTINFEQNLIHRFFKVKKLKIDTAGSSDKELELEAIDDEKAEALKEILITVKQNEAQTERKTLNLEQQASTQNKEEVEILKLSFIDLLKAGLFENHLKSVGLIFAAGWYIYSNAQEVGIDAEDYIDKVPPFAYGLYIVISGIVFFGLIAIVISLVKTILKYYDLKFTRILEGFKIRQGLFNTITVSALDHKIQTISWSDNLLKKIIGIFDLQLKQAKGRGTDETKESIIIPGCNESHINQVVSHLFPNEHIDLIELKKVDESYKNRGLFFALLIPCLINLLAILFVEWKLLVIGQVLLFLLPYMVVLRYRKLAFGFNDEVLRLKGGAFGDKNIVTAIYKIQTISKKQSPFQRKRGLASLYLQNASGNEVIPYIREEDANEIMNLFLKKVETDRRSWM